MKSNVMFYVVCIVLAFYFGTVLAHTVGGGLKSLNAVVGTLLANT